MSERAKGCTVAFHPGMREADIDATLIAIAQLRGVVSIAPTLETSDDWVAEQRARHELGRRLMSALDPDHAP